MDGLTGWLEDRMDGEMEERTHEWMDGRNERGREGGKEGCIDGWMEGRMEGGRDRRTGEWMYGRAEGRTDE